MPFLHDNMPSEKHIRCQFENLNLNHGVAIEEAIAEESDESLAMGGKRGSKRGPQLCGKCRRPRKGHDCPYETKKQKPRSEYGEKQTKESQTQTTEESFLRQKQKRQRGSNQMASKDGE
mmetsp:Transcript_6884/g.14165  ORF Transcript_6884/g.14165 Transcript_6884/m.14165 type:complete len:119 (+) Transcript_6884:102-458(+)